MPPSVSHSLPSGGTQGDHSKSTQRVDHMSSWVKPFSGFSSSTDAAQGPAYPDSPLGTQATPIPFSSHTAHAHVSGPRVSRLICQLPHLSPGRFQGTAPSSQMSDHITSPLQHMPDFPGLLVLCTRFLHWMETSQGQAFSCVQTPALHVLSCVGASGAQPAGSLPFLGTWEEHTSLLPCS